jgi:hypothetical protein
VGVEVAPDRLREKCSRQAHLLSSGAPIRRTPDFRKGAANPIWSFTRKFHDMQGNLLRENGKAAWSCQTAQTLCCRNATRACRALTQASNCHECASEEKRGEAVPVDRLPLFSRLSRHLFIFSGCNKTPHYPTGGSEASE